MLIYRSRVFDLYSTDVAAKHAPMEFIVHRGSCGALLVAPDGKIGLLLHHRPAIGQTLYEIPAGTLEYNRPVEDLMADELSEETGLTVELSQFERLTSAYASPGYSSELVTLFLVHLSDEQVKNARGLHWFNVNQERLAAMLRSGELLDMKTVTAISTYLVLHRSHDS